MSETHVDQSSSQTGQPTSQKDQTGQPSILESYISLFALDLYQLSEEIEDPFYLLEIDFNELNEYYTKKDNRIQCFSKKDYSCDSDKIMKEVQKLDQSQKDPNAVQIIIADTQHIDRVATITVNPYHLFCGIYHRWPIREKVMKMTMLEKKIFTESGIDTKDYPLYESENSPVEPIIVDNKARSCIMLEILLENVAKLGSPDQVVKMTFTGDKHMVNVWKKGLDLGEWLSFDTVENCPDAQELYSEKAPEEHVIVMTVLHPENGAVLVNGTFKYNMKELSKNLVSD